MVPRVLRRALKRGAVVVGRALEGAFDRLRYGVKRRSVWSAEIMPYRGHGTQETLFLPGRVLEAANMPAQSAEDHWGRNLRATIRRFASDEVPHARVRAHFRGRTAEAVADEEGFFELRLDLEQPLPPPTAWHEVGLELPWPPPAGVEGSHATTGRVLVPAGASFGVVSDLDDTVIQTGVTSLFALLRATLFGNAHTRLPFEGVAAFYRDLQNGPGGSAADGPNPIFYVSNGPWNLHDLLEGFLDVRGIPAGPLFLRDWSLTKLRDGGAHKLAVLRRLFAAYPDLSFVLVGDSGEQDPEIYRRVVQEHPNRVLAVYIRDVTTAERDAVVRDVAAEVRSSSGVEMLLAADTSAAARHAAALGLIAPDAPSVPRKGGA